MQQVQLQELSAKIVTIPGHPPAMLDADLAQVYGVSIKHLNQQAKRNPERFPPDFRFQPTREECLADPILRSQNVTIGASAQGRGHHRYLPWLYTHEGCVTMALILRTPFAAQQCGLMARVFVHVQLGQLDVGPVDARFLFQMETMNRRMAALERRVVTATPLALPAPERPPKKHAKLKRHYLISDYGFEEEFISLQEGGATCEKIAEEFKRHTGRAIGKSSVHRYSQALRAGTAPKISKDPRIKDLKRVLRCENLSPQERAKWTALLATEKDPKKGN